MDDTLNHEHFMARAITLAEAAAVAGEVPVGAVVVVDGEVVGEGANAPLSSFDPSAHAEIMAMRDAGQRLGNYRLTGATLYVTLEPCMMCTGAMVHARIDTVVFGARDPKSGVLGGNIDVSDYQVLNHKLKVMGGISEQVCGDLLRTFFRERRKK
ncbi:MAG: tRNA adenosine(34) deaminase TadA [Pseudomonadota bacterium]